MLPSKAKIEENEARDVHKDKGGSKEAIRCRFLGHCSVPRMGRQYRACPEKGCPILVFDDGIVEVREIQELKM